MVMYFDVSEVRDFFWTTLYSCRSSDIADWSLRLDSFAYLVKEVWFLHLSACVQTARHRC